MLSSNFVDAGKQINPGKFYHALALIRCKGDIQQAKKLLQQVSKEGLEGKEIAEEWLEEL